jgi:hypothetical protein
MKWIRTILPAALAVAALGGVAGCGGSGAGAASATNSYLGTQAPGDVWSWTVGSSTFTASNDTLGHTYSGTAQALPSGFTKLVVTSTNDPGVAAGSAAYAIEIPGVALMVKPAGGNDKPVIVASGHGQDIKGNTLSSNWVTIPSADYNSLSHESYGTAVFTKGPQKTWNGVIQQYMSDGTHLGQGTGSFTEHKGVLTMADSSAVAAMTSGGALILDNGPNMGGLVGLRVPASPLSLDEFRASTFRGIVVMNGETRGLYLQPHSGPMMLGGMYDEAGLETNTPDPDPEKHAYISIDTQPSPGIFRATLHTEGDDHNIILVVNKVKGKFIGFGLLAGDRGNMVLVQN